MNLWPDHCWRCCRKCQSWPLSSAVCAILKKQPQKHKKWCLFFCFFQCDLKYTPEYVTSAVVLRNISLMVHVLPLRASVVVHPAHHIPRTHHHVHVWKEIPFHSNWCEWKRPSDSHWNPLGASFRAAFRREGRACPPLPSASSSAASSRRLASA